jgi:hypothetical protein
MRRICLLLVLAMVPLGACGSSGSSGSSDFFLGPLFFGLPVFDDGSVKTLVLRNIADEDAPVRITTLPGAATNDVVVPALGELRIPVGAFFFGPVEEGWLIVDTRDPLTAVALATSGLVEPYFVTQRSGPDTETIYGAVLHSQKALMPIFPRTDRVLLANWGGAAAVYTVRAFGATDESTNPQIGADVPVAVGANDFQDISFVIAAIASQGEVGHIRVIPPGPGFRFTLASHQDQDLVHEVDDGLRGDLRLLNEGGTSNAEMMFEYGRDAQTGGFSDFHILISNPTEEATAFTLRSIHDEFGNAIKTTPRTFTLPPNQSRLLGTTLGESRGLQVGEINPLIEHFGDVFLATSMVRFRMAISAGNNMRVSGVQYDPVSLQFQSAVRPTALRRTVSVLMHDLQSSTASTTENWAWFSNPTTSPITVQVRAYTVTEGTAYLLDPIEIPPLSIYRFRGDGLHLKESPNSTVQPDVTHLRFLFSSNAAYGVRGVRLTRDAQGIYAAMSPHIIRFED